MKAWTLYGIGDIRFSDVHIPEISDDETLVKVKAAGICGSDIPRIYKTGAHIHPLILGHEFSGQVVKTGKNAAEWQDKRVGIFPLIPCMDCIPCRHGQIEMCRNYSYLGSRQNGAFAEYVAVPAKNLIELPENVSFEDAAMLEPMAVAVHAIKGINILRTDSAVVCGLGTIGLFTIMFLRAMGISEIFAIGSKDFQMDKVQKLGIPKKDCCDIRKENPIDWIIKKTNGNGIDVFFECVGKNETVLQAVECTAPAGKIMLVGNPYSNMTLEKSVYWKILRNQLTLKGTWNSSFSNRESCNWHYVLNMLVEGKISPSLTISHRFEIEDLEKGLHIMRDKSEDYCKIMMINSEE